jgi:hypothetical protein
MTSNLTAAVTASVGIALPSKARRQRQLAQEFGVVVDPDTGEIRDP